MLFHTERSEGFKEQLMMFAHAGEFGILFTYCLFGIYLFEILFIVNEHNFIVEVNRIGLCS